MLTCMSDASVAHSESDSARGMTCGGCDAGRLSCKWAVWNTLMATIREASSMLQALIGNDKNIHTHIHTHIYTHIHKNMHACIDIYYIYLKFAYLKTLPYVPWPRIPKLCHGCDWTTVVFEAHQSICKQRAILQAKGPPLRHPGATAKMSRLKVGFYVARHLLG